MLCRFGRCAEEGSKLEGRGHGNSTVDELQAAVKQLRDAYAPLQALLKSNSSDHTQAKALMVTAAAAYFNCKEHVKVVKARSVVLLFCLFVVSWIGAGPVCRALHAQRFQARHVQVSEHRCYVHFCVR
jgi:hypothetical protein